MFRKEWKGCAGRMWKAKVLKTQKVYEEESKETTDQEQEKMKEKTRMREKKGKKIQKRNNSTVRENDRITEIWVLAEKK